MLKDKLKDISLLDYIEGNLYIKAKTFKDGTNHIGLFLKIEDKVSDKRIYWISPAEADILSELGILLID